ncbi:MAG: DegT/DnrJ/EryC1/StrS aminotransferase family protein [Spirochaetales bacterium]|nr:DegT/DnrJ/EryC1/StrS aminotransferase family protein [Spirochaetales bacterium]
MDSVLTCMVSDRLAPGLYAQEFVREMAARLQAAGGAALAGYYAAIGLAFDLLELQRGDAVVLTPLAPSLYATALAERGLVPLFVDVDPRSGLMTPGEFDKALAKSPKAVVVHHSLGLVCNAEQYSGSGLKVIEDVSQALGASWGEKPAGGVGTVVVASLGEENLVTAGGGGLVLARKKGEAQNLKRLLEKNPGYPLLPDLNAAVALSQIKELPSFLKLRREIASIYNDALGRSRHSTLIQDEGGEAVPFSFPVVVETSMKDVRQFARKKGIDTRAAFNETVMTMDDSVYNQFPNAKALLLRCVLFPLYPMLGRANVESIAKVLAVLP